MDDNKQNKLKSMKRNKILFSVVFLILGILLVIWPRQSAAIGCRMIGAAVLVYGIITVIHYFTKKDTVPKLLLFTGIVIAVIGLSILAFPDWLLKFIPKLAGVIILIDGAANLVENMTLGKQNYKKWWLSLIFAILTIAVGLALIIKPLGAIKLIFILIGASMIFDAVTSFWIATRIRTEAIPDVTDAQTVDYKDVDE